MTRSIGNMKIYFTAIFWIVCCQIARASASSYSSFVINHLQGLSNSAVLSILQDNQGLMWFGTYDGLNCYDGRTIEVFRTDFSKGRTLDNNIISRIQVAGNDKLWVQSFLGINLFSTDSLSVIDNYIFPNEETIVYSNRKGDSWVLGKRNLYYYNTYHQCFIKADSVKMHLDNLAQCAFVDDKGGLHVVPANDTQMYHFSLNTFSSDSLQVHMQVASSPLHSKHIKNTFIQGGVIGFIDEAYDLYLYDVSKKSKMYIRNVRELYTKYGNFIDVFPFYDDILVTLHTGGVLRLMASQQYAEDLMRVDLRIFSAYTDNQQGILWLGTDGNGVVKFTKKNALVTNLLLNHLSPAISGQVRGIMTDRYGTLWIGTKGDGLICIPDYQKDFDGKSLFIYSPKGKLPLANYMRGPNFYPVFLLKNTQDLLMDKKISQTSGFSEIKTNAGSIRNTGIELSISGTPVRTADFEWNIGANITYNKNQITDLGTWANADNKFVNGDYLYEVGKSLGTWYMVEWAGVNPETGEVWFYDQKGGKTEDISQAPFVDKFKSSEVPVFGGFDTSLTYKGISLSANFTYALNYYIMNATRWYVDNHNFNGNKPAYMLTMWRQPGDITNVPRFDSQNNPSPWASQFLEDASFLRLKTLRLSWTPSRKLLEKQKVFQSMNIFCQGENLFTVTGYSGMDPEVSGDTDYMSYPTPISVTFGVNVSF